MENELLMRLHPILFSALLLLSGCQLLPDPNALPQQGNTITNGSLDLAVTISDDYTFLGEFEYSGYTRFINTTGGTNNVGNFVLFSDSATRSFILIKKITCNRRCTFSAISNVPESEKSTSFYVGKKKIYKQHNQISLDKGAKNKLAKLLYAGDNTTIDDGKFSTSGYANAVRNSYFTVLVATHNDQSAINIKDVVTLKAL
jgi:hypothetical protein